MSWEDEATEALLERVRQGDAAATELLLNQHRQRMCRMVGVRLDPCVSARLDPSDVVQESLLEASGRLCEYAQAPPLPFYPWLRQIAWKFVLRAHRRHLCAARRTVLREIPLRTDRSNASRFALANALAASVASPSKVATRRELRAQVRVALDELRPADRELLVLRYLEGLSFRDIGWILNIGESAAEVRHLRALQHLAERLKHHGIHDSWEVTT